MGARKCIADRPVHGTRGIVQSPPFLPLSHEMKQTASRANHRTFAIATLMFVLASGLIAGLAFSMHSVLQDGAYVVEGQPSVPFSFPLKIQNASNPTITVTFGMRLGTIHPTRFDVTPDDCLQAVWVNGQAMENKALPYCDYNNPISIDFGNSLRSGGNVIIALIKNNGGDAGLTLHPSSPGFLSLLPLLLFVAALLAYVLFIMKMCRRPAWQKATATIAILGFALRIFYLLRTPFWIRGHDTDGHIDYIRYLAAHAALPIPNKGWEFWQPPLYYAISAIWMNVGSPLHLTNLDTLFGVQVLSLMFSVATILLILWIAAMCTPPAYRPIALPLVALLCAFFPGLVLQAAVINNDTLTLTLTLLAIALLIRWWQKESRRVWIWVAIVTGLAIIAKNTALLIIPIALLCLLLSPRLERKKKISLGVSMLCIVTVIAGWFSVYRIIQDRSQPMIIGNNAALNAGLSVPNTVKALTTFNPVAITRIPYNDAWNDAARRQNFWEYWYRSAFYGEFSFGDAKKSLASMILAGSFALLLFALIGIIRSAKQSFKATLPLLLCLLVLPLGHLLFRIQEPFSSSEDFRYSLPFLAPMFFYAAFGVASCRSVFMKNAGIALVTVLAALCGVFLVQV